MFFFFSNITGNVEYMICGGLNDHKFICPGRRQKNGNGACANHFARHKLYILLCAGFCFSLFFVFHKINFPFPVFGLV
jgi:hypothetical protein